MSWLEDLDRKERSLKNRFEQCRHSKDHHGVDFQELAAEVGTFSETLDSHFSGLKASQENALRYALRLRLPVLHHLQGITRANGTE